MTKKTDPKETQAQAKEAQADRKEAQAERKEAQKEAKEAKAAEKEAAAAGGEVAPVPEAEAAAVGEGVKAAEGLAKASAEAQGDKSGVAGPEALQALNTALQAFLEASGGSIQTETIQVQSGSTLWSLAEEHMSNGQFWRILYGINLDTITLSQEIRDKEATPNLIYPGAYLRILK